MDDILNDPKVKQWFKVIRASESTRELYSNYIKKFCKVVGKTPTELITLSIAEYKAGKMPSERSDFEYITTFLDVLENEDYAPKSINLLLNIVRSFYKTFDIIPSSSIGANQDNEVMEENVNFLSREDIINLITHARTLRDRAIILAMVTSGMARNNIVNLKIGDIEFEDGIGIIGKKRRTKSRTDFMTFISPEACKALQDYFDERNRDPATKINGDNDYVFVTYPASQKAPAGQKLNKYVFIKIFQRLADDLGYNNGIAYGFVKSRSHALRKFFATNLQKSGMPKNYIDFMMGHKVNEIDFAYFQNDDNVLKDLYIKHLQCLTFDKVLEVRSLDTKDQKKLEELEKENETIKADYEVLMAKYNDIANDNELSEMRQILHDFQQRDEEREKQLKDVEKKWMDFLQKLPPELIQKVKAK